MFGSRHIVTQKQVKAERETLQHEIDEARAIVDSVNVDRQTIQDYKELKNEMDLSI
jgi:hypothetical protein